MTKAGRIERALRERVAAALPHDPVPSEAALCEEFEVSRMTARGVLQRLVADGLVYRQVGRGSFVAPPAVVRRADALVRFSAEMRRQGRRPSSRVLSAGLRPARGAEAARLGVGAGEDVVAVERLRLADDVPVALERAVFPGRLQGLLDADLARESLHEVLGRLGRAPARGHATVAARAADETEWRLLDLAAGAALLVESRVIVDRDGQAVEFTESRYAGERYGLLVAFTVEEQ
ncbi:GntR family transcriptional regulator [Dactylosporangium sp. CA-233914]|uniref:GntR family transcriptional regulator n=1 Tax=Dactylosporangium sp. CA-233914 TaxID=3239934 RepID=UPI003D8E3734